MESLLQDISTFFKYIFGTIKMTSIFFQMIQFILKPLMTVFKNQWIVYAMMFACLIFGIDIIVQFVWEKLKYLVVYFIAPMIIIQKLVTYISDLYTYTHNSHSI